MFDNFKFRDNIDTFLNSLNYWQTINLYTVLAQGQYNLTYNQAKAKAMIDFGDKSKLKILLEQALNSPDTKM